MPTKIAKLEIKEEKEEDLYNTITKVKDLEFPDQEVDSSIPEVCFFLTFHDFKDTNYFIAKKSCQWRIE